ncbi:MAG: hypothetical protein ACRCXX_00520 [Cetobacterium sp.]|uniref:hypothetical protein n=1 Tax=Cetobacterium sp. TaxID=2071632 RepID=UPI003EE5CC13
MRKMNMMVLVGSLLMGTMAFAEREVEFDYKKNLEERNQRDQKNIEAYAESNNVSIEVAAQKYYQKLQQEFKNNEALRQEMIKSSSDQD